MIRHKEVLSEGFYHRKKRARRAPERIGVFTAVVMLIFLAVLALACGWWLILI